MSASELNHQYPGRELEAMAEAINYHRWILDMFKPYLGRRIVEVGAGAGSFSKLILENLSCETLWLVEPADSLYGELETFAKTVRAATRVNALHGTFSELAAAIDPAPDSIIYVNVLEHVEDDEGELRNIAETLTTNGRLMLFVPALGWLYGQFDKEVGHYRRYERRDLERKLRRAGFKILHSRYVDAPGMAPWWIKYRLLRSHSMEPGAVRFYDRFVVPGLRAIETRLPPPLGKNLCVVGEKI